MDSHYWNGVILTPETWKAVLKLKADQIRFVTEYVKQRYHNGRTGRDSARIAVQKVSKQGGERRPAAYLNTPEVAKAIKYLSDIKADEILSELRPMAIKALSDRAFYRAADYFDSNGDLKQGVTLDSFPPHLIDSIIRKPRKSGIPEEDIIEIKPGDRQKSLDLIVKILGIVQEDKSVNVEINNTVNVSAERKREILQKYKERIEKIKNQKKE